MMVVMVLERASASLRGRISRWMVEVKAGVFVGSLSARVRDLLWESVCSRNRDGGSVLVYAAPNEQGFVILGHGEPSRVVIDMEGLLLVKRMVEGGRRRKTSGG